MRILYPLLWSTLARQACREQSLNTIVALARRGHELTVLMPQRPQDPDLDADDLRAFFHGQGQFRLVQRRSRWIGEGAGTSLMWLRQVSSDPELRGADLLYSRIPVMLAAGLVSPLPFATDHYRPWPNELPALRPLMRMAARRRVCAGFILHSHFAAEAYRHAGIAEEKILVAHNGADPVQAMGKKEARAKLGLPPARAIALYAGRLGEDKGLDQVLAMAALRPDILFLLVGSDGEGAIERQAAAQDNVRIVPWADPAMLPAWLQAADVLLIPPSRAPLQRFRTCVLPMKLFAYLAAGRPILAPVSPDTAELLRHEETALLVPAEQPQASAAALDRLLRDVALAERLGTGARRLSAGLSWDSRAEKISAFLEARLRAIEASRRPAQRSLYSSTVTPISATMSGAPQAPASGGKEPTWAATVSTPSATR